jgi:hypothetical protein
MRKRKMAAERQAARRSRLRQAERGTDTPAEEEKEEGEEEIMMQQEEEGVEVSDNNKVADPLPL